MGGYVARVGKSAGLLDRLRATCFLFRAHGESAAVLVLEVLGISAPWASTLQRVVATETGVEPSHVIVAGTHTHSGPDGLASTADTEPMPDGHSEPGASILRGVHEAVVEAARNVQPAEVGFGEMHDGSIAKHRTMPDREVDSVLWLLRVDDRRGRLRALLGNYPCHSTVLSAENLLLSGDLLGGAAARAETLASGKVTACFSYGAAGDLSTRFSRRNQDPDELDRLARILAEQTIDLARQVTTTREPIVRAVKRTCTVPLRPTITAQDAFEERERITAQLADASGHESAARRRILETRLEGVREYASRLATGAPSREQVELEITGLRIGAGYVVAVPGEPFHQLSRSLRATAGPGRHVAVFACANGYLGYFPDQEAVDGGWYEAQISRFDQRALEQVTQTAQGVISELKGVEDA